MKQQQMFKLMNDLVMDQIVSEISEAERVGNIEEMAMKMKNNKLHFCKMLMRKPEF